MFRVLSMFVTILSIRLLNSSNELRLEELTDHLNERCSTNQSKESPAYNCNRDSGAFFPCIFCKCKSLLLQNSDELQCHKGRIRAVKPLYYGQPLESLGRVTLYVSPTQDERQ